MSQAPRLGFAAIARTTFDVALAEAAAQAAWQALKQAGFEVIGDACLLTEQEALHVAARTLGSELLDALVVFQATFTDSTFITHLAEATDAPLLLWAVPEARTGGRLRLNSLCGINLAGHALTLRHRVYEWIYAAPGDPQAIATIDATAKAGRARRRLRQARIGLLGEPPVGFDSCYLDADQLHSRLGVRIVRLDLADVLARARSVDEAQRAAIYAQVAARVAGLEALAQAPLAGTLAVYATLKALAAELDCDALAVRCWPEFFTELGCAACGAMALLNTEHVPCGCECDINGTLSQLMLQWIAEQPAFGTDLVECNPAEDTAVVWHCGQAPLSMADPTVPVRGGVHSNRQLPLVMEFALKPGVVTLARLSQASGGLRLVTGSGEMLAAPPSFSGTSGVLRFTRPVQTVLSTLISQGLEHHLALAYGDHTAALHVLARLMNLPTLSL
jgi:L-fucose isomerase-like protein